MLWIRQCFGQRVEEGYGKRSLKRASSYKVSSELNCHERVDSETLDHATFLSRIFQSPAPFHTAPASAPGNGHTSPTTWQHPSSLDRCLAVACSVQAHVEATPRRPRRGLIVHEARGRDPLLSIRVIWVALNSKQSPETCTSHGPASTIPSPEVESYQRLLGDLMKADEELKKALQEVARSSYYKTYCAIKHKPRPNSMRDTLQGMDSIEISTCCLALDAGRNVPGLQLVFHGSTAASSRLVPEPSSSCLRSPGVTSIVSLGGTGRGLGTSKVTPVALKRSVTSTVCASQQKLKDQSVAATAAVRTPSWSPLRSAMRLPSLTAKMRLAAAARAVAAEVLPASILVFTYSRGNTLAEVAYLNSRAREYLCLDMGGQMLHQALNLQFAAMGLQALPARALLAAILQYEGPNVVRQLHQAAASEQGFCATLKVPAYIDGAGLALAHPHEAAGLDGGGLVNSGNVGSCSEDGDTEEEQGEEAEEEKGGLVYADDDEATSLNDPHQTSLKTISDISEDGNHDTDRQGQGQGHRQGQAQSEATKLGLTARGPSLLSLRSGNMRPRTSIGMSALRVSSRRGSTVAAGTAGGLQVTARAVSMRAHTTTNTHTRVRTAMPRNTSSMEFPGPELRMLSRAVLSVHGDILRPQSLCAARTALNIRSGRTALLASGGAGGEWAGGGGNSGQVKLSLSPTTSRRRLQAPVSPRLVAAPASGFLCMVPSGTLTMGNTLDAADQELLQRLAGPCSGSGSMAMQARASSRPNPARQLGVQHAVTAASGGDEFLRHTPCVTAISPFAAASCNVSLRPTSDLRGGAFLEGLSRTAVTVGGAETAAEGYRQPTAMGMRAGGVGTRGKKPGARRVATLAVGQMKQWVNASAAKVSAAPLAPTTTVSPGSYAAKEGPQTVAGAAAAAATPPETALPVATAISAPEPAASLVSIHGGGDDGGGGKGANPPPKYMVSLLGSAGDAATATAAATGSIQRDGEAANWMSMPFTNSLACQAMEDAQEGVSTTSRPALWQRDSAQVISAARMESMEIAEIADSEATVEMFGTVLGPEDVTSSAANTTAVTFASSTSLAAEVTAASLAAAATAAAKAQAAVAAAAAMAVHQGTGSGGDGVDGVHGAAGTRRTAPHISTSSNTPAMAPAVKRTKAIAKRLSTYAQPLLPAALAAATKPSQLDEHTNSTASEYIPRGRSGNTWLPTMSSSAPAPRLDVLTRAYRTVGDAVSRLPTVRSRLCSSGAGVLPSSAQDLAQGTTPTNSSFWRAGAGGSVGSSTPLVPAASALQQVPLQRRGTQTSNRAQSTGAAPQDCRQWQDEKQPDGDDGGSVGTRRVGRTSDFELACHNSANSSPANSGGYGSNGLARSGSNSTTALLPMLQTSGGGSASHTPLHRLILLQQRVPSKSRMSAEIVRDGAPKSSGGGGVEGLELHSSAASSLTTGQRRSMHSTLAFARPSVGPVAAAAAATASATAPSDALVTSNSGGNLVSAGLVISGGNSALYGGAVGGPNAIPSGSSGVVPPTTFHVAPRDSGLTRWESGPAGGIGNCTPVSERLVTTTRPMAMGGILTGSASGCGCWTATAVGNVGPNAGVAARTGFATSSAMPVRNGRRGNSVRDRVHALLDQVEQVEMQRAASNGIVSGICQSHSVSLVSLRPASVVAAYSAVSRPPSTGLWHGGTRTPPGGGGGPSSVTVATLSPSLRCTGEVPCHIATSASGRRSSTNFMPYEDLLTVNASVGAAIAGGVCSRSSQQLQHHNQHHNAPHQQPPGPVSIDACVGFGDSPSPFLNTMSRQESAMLQILTSIDDGGGKGDGSGVIGAGITTGTAGGSGIFLHLGNSGGGVTGLIASGGSVSAAAGSGGVGPSSSSGSHRPGKPAGRGPSRQPISMRWLSDKEMGISNDAVLHEHGIMTATQPSPLSITATLVGTGSRDKALLTYGDTTEGGDRGCGGCSQMCTRIEGSTGDLAANLMGKAADGSLYFADSQQHMTLPCDGGVGSFESGQGAPIPGQQDRTVSGAVGDVGVSLGNDVGGMNPDRNSGFTGVDVGVGVTVGQNTQGPQMSLRNDGISVAATGVGGMYGMVPGVAAGAWCQLRARTCTTVDGRRVLMLIMSDVTKQIQNQERVASLVEQEHRILEALFPRHVIAYLTAPTEGDNVETGGRGTGRVGGGSGGGGAGGAGAAGGIGLGSNAMIAAALASRGSRSASRHSAQGPSPRWRRAAGASIGSRRGDIDVDEPPAQPSEMSLRGLSQLRQMALQHHHNTVKVSRLATAHKMVTILFSDIVGFTAFSRQVPPITVMRFLNEFYQKLDALLDIYKVYKVETIGDCYVVAGGLVRYDEDGLCTVLPEGEIDELHAVRVMEFAKAMLRASREVRLPTTGEPVQIRLGLHSGPAMSGVVGSKMPRFTVFGETVEAAHRMESSGKPGRIHVSGVTKALLRSETWEQTEGVQIEGRGRIDTYLWLEDEEADSYKQRVMAVYL